MSKDNLGDRMKSQYEVRTRYFLPRRTYTIIRLDGKSFHTFTKGFDRPFDKHFVDIMNYTAKYLCENIQGVKIAYVQSDEITLVLTDFDKITTDAFFDGNIQKITSVSASMATLAFNNRLRDLYIEVGNVKGSKFKTIGEGFRVALFDSRVFTIADRQEVFNCLIWRQQDATRNSIQMLAQSLYSHKELHGKNTSEQQDMIFQKGTNWNDIEIGYKRGRVVVKEFFKVKDVNRTIWNIKEPPIFSKDRGYLESIIPSLERLI